jgi:hypothetical protein
MISDEQVLQRKKQKRDYLKLKKLKKYQDQKREEKE